MRARFGPAAILRRATPGFDYAALPGQLPITSKNRIRALRGAYYPSGNPSTKRLLADWDVCGPKRDLAAMLNP
jgi:hypothetical protein